VTIKSSLIGFIFLCLMAMSALPLTAQDSAWSSVLQQLDNGEKTLEQVTADPTLVLMIAGQEDIDAITAWIKTLDAKSPGEQKTQVATLNFLLIRLLEWEYSEHPKLSVARLHSEFERLLRQFLALPNEELKSIEDIPMRTLQFLALSKSKQYVSLLLLASEKEQLQQNEFWRLILDTLSTEDSALFSLKRKVLDGVIQGNLAVAIVEYENDLAYDQENFSHFLNGPEGERLIREWLSPNLSEEMKSHNAPKTAAICLAFAEMDDWQELIKLARTHPDFAVALEGAWAGARRKDDESIDRLIELAKDVRTSRTAVTYMNELSLEDRIPSETQDPAFAAKAELAEWLSYPTEKGRPPDEMSIVETRNLKWPLEDDPVDVRLIQFVYKDPAGVKPDEVDIGLVGPMTFCHFEMKMSTRPKEDIYAIHVYRELEAYDLIESVDLAAQPAAYDYMLKTWKGDTLVNAKIVYVAKLERSVGYPRRLLALASATLNGEEGFVVLDGPRSKWYAKKSQVADTPESAFLMIHLGKELLNF
jgi:hypothetical protein